VAFFLGVKVAAEPELVVFPFPEFSTAAFPPNISLELLLLGLFRELVSNRFVALEGSPDFLENISLLFFSLRIFFLLISFAATLSQIGLFTGGFFLTFLSASSSNRLFLRIQVSTQTYGVSNCRSLVSFKPFLRTSFFFPCSNSPSLLRSPSTRIRSALTQLTTLRRRLRYCSRCLFLREMSNALLHWSEFSGISADTIRRWEPSFSVTCFS